MNDKQLQHTTKEIVSRKLWVFTCENCQKKRRLTFYRSKASNGLCRSCRASALERHHNANQLSIFEAKPALVEEWKPEPEVPWAA